MKKLLKKRLKDLESIKNYIAMVLLAPNEHNIFWLDCLKAKAHLFTPNEFYSFDLKNNRYEDYISDYERVRSRNINPTQKIIIDDKLIYEEIFKKYVRVPITYAYVINGNVHGKNGYNVTDSNIIDFIKEKKDVVLKWALGYEGKGTYVIHYMYDDKFNINEHILSSKDFLSLLNVKNIAILCEFIKQSTFAAELYPFSTNTMRIICAKKKNEEKAHVIKAAQRIGNKMSAPVDNVSAGALSCEIDIESGKLLEAVIAKPKIANSSHDFFDKHPETGAQLSGKQIPNWNSIITEVEYVTNQFPYLNFVAWDVVLVNDGICFIEGNASSGLMMFQQRHGVRNGIIGDIYRSYGIIK